MLFHFLRPWWFLAFIPAICLTVLLLKYSSSSNNWLKYCDAHLLEHILVDQPSKAKKSLLPLALLLLWGLAIIALAGPTWSYKNIPVYKKTSARVIALDVSQSMDTTDISPSRLERAKYKILDILNNIKEGQVGMIVFSGEPFVVSPLTSDAKTIKNMVPVINTNIVPVQGHDIYKALKKSAELITQAGSPKGQIILITDSTPTNNAINEAKKLAEEGIETDVYAIGTPQGGVARDEQGNFVKNEQGNFEHFGINLLTLQKLTSSGDGRLIFLTLNNTDIKELLGNIKYTNSDAKKSKQSSVNTLWQDESSSIIWLLVILSALVFRKSILEKICR